MHEQIVLRTGGARWLRYGHGAVSLAALLSLAASGAQPAWIAAMAGAILLTHRVAVWRMADPQWRGRLHLAADGDALLFTAGGVRALRQQPGGWHSRVLCVLPLEDTESGRCHRLVVCRSLNRPEPWRRLLVRLKSVGRGAA